MFAIGKKILSLLLLVFIAVAPMSCLTINKPPDDQPNKETKVGGDNGVVVDHSDSGTKVKVGGDRGVVVDHPND